MTKRPEILDLAIAGQLERALQGTATPDFSRGKCTGMNVNLFFTESKNAVARAKAICAQCPIANQCAEWAATNAEEGIFGGMTPSERKLKFGKGLAPTTTSRHDLQVEINFVMGASAREVAMRYGVDMRTVVRWRNILRDVGVAA